MALPNQGQKPDITEALRVGLNAMSKQLASLDRQMETMRHDIDETSRAVGIALSGSSSQSSGQSGNLASANTWANMPALIRPGGGGKGACNYAVYPVFADSEDVPPVQKLLALAFGSSADLEIVYGAQPDPVTDEWTAKVADASSRIQIVATAVCPNGGES